MHNTVFKHGIADKLGEPELDIGIVLESLCNGNPCVRSVPVRNKVDVHGRESIKHDREIRSILGSTGGDDVVLL